MKRMAGLLAIVLGSMTLLFPQDKAKGTEMTGVLCNSKCVKQDAGKAVCDSTCSEKSKDVVFVDDQGKATPVANPNMAKGKMGKKVKVHGEMMKGKDMMEIYDVVFANAG
jgi:hypothetical protein